MSKNETQGKIILGSAVAWYPAEDVLKKYPQLRNYPHEIIYVEECNRNFICINAELIPTLCKDLKCNIEISYDTLMKEWKAMLQDM